jgi:hypothetical protein
MRRRTVLLPVVALLAAAPAGAAAAPVLSTTVDSGGATATACHTRLLPAGDGVVTRRVTMPASGIVSARLTGGSGDWDLGVVDVLTGRVVAAGAGFGADELASGFAGGGRQLVVQACRRRGASSRAALTVSSTAVPTGRADQRPAITRVRVADRAQKALLGQLGFDLTEHAGPGFVDVLTTSDDERRRLGALGMPVEERVRDLVADQRRALARPRAAAAAAAGQTAMPSGRTAYRRLADYEADLKALVAKYPKLARPVTLKNKTLEGRTVNGIEIATDVAQDDGRPVFLQMGVHHAREWPSGEHAIEWAFELLQGIGSDPELTRLAERVRTIVVPIVNPDGFNVSREAPTDVVNDPQYQQIPDTGLNETAAYLVDPALNYKRRNCRLTPSQPFSPAGLCATPPFRLSGVDPNRNYGGFWGGPGASALPVYDTYRGEGPFSEPETQNVRDLVSRRHVTTLITNHTFSNLVLRPPGIKAAGKPVDEDAMKALGDAMAARNGYTSQPSFGLYDTTGGTEDWTYYATGGFGYTFEIGPDVDPAEGGGFHPPYPFTVQQWYRGSNDGGGNRAAYRVAMASAADPAKHSTLTGSAPAGVTLRLRKEFVTETSPVQPAQTDLVDAPSPAGPKQTFPDVLDTTLPIGRRGAFRWSVNPSTRPVVDTRSFDVDPAPARTETFGGDGTDTGPGATKDFPFKVLESDARALLRVTVDVGETDDYDTELFRIDGGKETPVGSSGGFLGVDEVIEVGDPQPGDYVLRVANFAAVGPYSVKTERFGPGTTEVRPRAATEAWTLRCEVGTTVVSEQKVVVERGQQLAVPAPCGPNAEEVVAAAKAQQSGSRAPASGASSCAPRAGFLSASARAVRGGRGLSLRFVRRTAQPVTVDVFQVAKGRTVLRERRVARFRGLRRSITWDGTATGRKAIGDGTFFVRYAIKGLRGRTDVRRFAFERRDGRFRSLRAHYRPDSCGLLASAKLERPAFGGLRTEPLRIAFRVARRADVTVTVRRGARVVRTFRRPGTVARRTHRLRVEPRGLAKGTYTVTVTARAARGTATAMLVSRRL